MAPPENGVVGAGLLALVIPTTAGSNRNRDRDTPPAAPLAACQGLMGRCHRGRPSRSDQLLRLCQDLVRVRQHASVVRSTNRTTPPLPDQEGDGKERAVRHPYRFAWKSV